MTPEILSKEEWIMKQEGEPWGIPYWKLMEGYRGKVDYKKDELGNDLVLP